MEFCGEKDAKALVVDRPVSADASDRGVCLGRSQYPDLSATVAPDSLCLQTLSQL